MFTIKIKNHQIRPEIFDNTIFCNQLKAMRIFGYIIGTNQNHQLMHFIRCTMFTFSFAVATILLFVKISRSVDNIEANATSWATAFFFLATSTAVVNMYFQRKRVFTLINFIHDDLDLLRSHADDEERIIFNHHLEHLRKITLLLWIPTLVGGNLAWIDCLVRSILYPETVFNIPQILNGTAQPVMLLRIFPFGEIYDNFFMGYLMPYYIAFLAIITIPVLHTFITCLMQYVLIKMDIISKRLRDMDFSKIGSSVESGEHIQDLEEDEKNYWRLKMCGVCVKEQIKIRWFTRELLELMRIPVFLDFIIFSVIICFILYFLVNGNPSELDYIFNFMYLSVTTSILWLYHWHATLVAGSMDNLCYAIYCCDWYNYPLHVQKSIRLLMMSSSRPLEMRALFVTLNLRTFIDILKGAVSYFSILRNLNAS